MTHSFGYRAAEDGSWCPGYRCPLDESTPFAIRVLAFRWRVWAERQRHGPDKAGDWPQLYRCRDCRQFRWWSDGGTDDPCCDACWVTKYPEQA